MSEVRTSSFRLVDLLAVILVLAILAGVLFPFLLSVKDNPHHRPVCISNQKNIALALLCYENAKGGFPAWRQQLGTQGRTGSWAVAILPYLEEPVVYDRFCDNPDISDIRDYQISVFQCPAMEYRYAGSRISYVVNGGMQDLALDENGNVARIADLDLRNGIFFDGLAEAAPRSTLEYIVDDKGTSNTILMAENSQAGTWWDTEEALTTFVYPATVSNSNGDRTSCDAKKIVEYRDTWLPLLPGRCPKGLPFFPSGPGDFSDYRYARPASPHPGVFVGSLCDGSVRTFNNDLDPDVFRKLMKAREDEPDRSVPVDFDKL